LGKQISAATGKLHIIEEISFFFTYPHSLYNSGALNLN